MGEQGKTVKYLGIWALGLSALAGAGTLFVSVLQSEPAIEPDAGEIESASGYAPVSGTTSPGLPGGPFAAAAGRSAGHRIDSSVAAATPSVQTTKPDDQDDNIGPFGPRYNMPKEMQDRLDREMRMGVSGEPPDVQLPTSDAERGLVRRPGLPGLPAQVVPADEGPALLPEAPAESTGPSPRSLQAFETRFLAEGPDPQWAPAEQARIDEALRSSGVQETSARAAECRETRCRVQVAVRRPEELSPLMEAANSLGSEYQDFLQRNEDGLEVVLYVGRDGYELVPPTSDESVENEGEAFANPTVAEVEQTDDNE